MINRFFRSRQGFRYSRWDGTQRLDDLDAKAILDALSDDYLKHGDLRRALERMMQQGFRDREGQRHMGLQDLLKRLREERQRRQQRNNMSGVMDDIKEKLEHIKQLEREGIQRRLDEQGIAPSRSETSADTQNGSPEGAQEQDERAESTQGQDGAEGQGQQGRQSGKRGQRQPGTSSSGQRGQQRQGAQQAQSSEQDQSDEAGQSGQSGLPEGVDTDALRRMLENIAGKKLQFLDELPRDPAGQIKQLTDYDFMDDQARQEFQDLIESLQQQVMNQYFQGFQQALQNMTPEDIARMREMVRALNQMLRERAEGREPDFDSFMQQYGDYFPGVNSLDDLIEQMRRRQDAMQAVMDSMSAEQREQLQDMMEELIGDDRLRVDLAELAMNLETVSPSEANTRYRLSGDQPLSLAEAMDLMGTLQEMDELESSLSQARRSGELDGLDPEQMANLVGEEEAAALRELQSLMQQLEEQGLVERKGDRYELTSQGIRRIGQKALEDIFAQLKKDAFGQHRLPERGYGGERNDETKPYTFGDPFHLHLEHTLHNAIARGGAGTPVRLDRDDFEVYRTEQMTQSATVVMLDMSWSMYADGLWLAAKKVAIALESLIRGQFPRDQLYVVGFNYLARRYTAEDLVNISEFDHGQGTNIIHGLQLARQLLAQSRATNKQIIMITDGGPTVWDEQGRWLFEWPTNDITEWQTLREVYRCQRDRIVINVFMLSDEYYLKRFVNRMATANKGRAFYVSPDNLGEYILIDYLGHKQKHVS